MVEGLIGIVKGEKDVKMRFEDRNNADDFVRSFGRYLVNEHGVGAFPIRRYKHGEEVRLTIPSGSYHAVERFLSRRRMEPRSA